MTNQNHGQQRALLFVRSATCNPEQIKAQIDTLTAFAAARNLAVVDAVALDGVSGLLPDMGTAVDRLMQRHAERADFEVVLVTEISRLGRMNSAHMHAMLMRLADIGVRVQTTAQPWKSSWMLPVEEVDEKGKGVDEPSCEE